MGKNPVWRKEVRQKISESLKGHKQSFETRQKRSLALKLYWSTHEQPKQKRDKCRKARLKQGQILKDTKIELLMQNGLRKEGLTFKTHFPIECTIPDIVFPAKQIAIFCDGDYWHNLPKVKARDKGINKILQLRGWKVLRFSENEIHTNLSKCIEEVIENVR